MSPLHIMSLEDECFQTTPSDTLFAIRFMSNPHLNVEKVTESYARNTMIKVSFGLAANDTDREGVAFT